MLASPDAQNLSIPNHYFAFLRQVMEKLIQDEPNKYHYIRDYKVKSVDKIES